MLWQSSFDVFTVVHYSFTLFGLVDRYDILGIVTNSDFTLKMLAVKKLKKKE